MADYGTQHASAQVRRDTSPPMAGFPAAILRRGDFAGSAARFYQSSYTSDYVGLALIIILYVMMKAVVEPFHRLFSLDDLAIQFPHAEVERVPVSILFVYTLVVPIASLAIWAVVFRPSVHKTHVTFLGFLISIFLTEVLTDMVKNGVGRPRPDLIDRCIPAPATPEHALVDFHVCTQPNHHILHDGFRSFPSGHSSLAFSGLGYLALFLCAQTHTLHPHSSVLALLLTVLPLIAALLIAISRCEDYRHDVWDVTAGSTLGMTISWLTYRRYYPALRSKMCETPYPSRSEVLGRWLKESRGDEENGLSRSSREVGIEEEDERALLEAGMEAR